MRRVIDHDMKKMLAVQPFQETLHAGMCGPASLKIVLTYYGVEKEEMELAQMCRTNRDDGTRDQDIKRVAEDLGFRVEIKNESDFCDIERWLDRGVPVIVDWFTRGRRDYTNAAVADGHYSVVCGMDASCIYLQDPEIGGIRKVDKEDFMTVWFDFSGRYITPDTLIVRQIIAVYRPQA